MKRLLFLFAFFPISLFAQKAQKYQAVTQTLAEKITAAAGTKELHLAVVPFTATQSSTQKSQAFGEYLTESIIGSLGSDHIRLFERTRMDAILKEQEFILTDLMKPSAALKVGQLAPIDAILSGTYTKLRSYIDVSARLIDVESGEITVSYSGRVKMNKNLAALFNNGAAVAETGAQQKTGKGGKQEINITFSSPGGTTAKTKAEICKQRSEEMSSRLHDLTTDQKVDAVVTEAIKYPFEPSCFLLHYNVMSAFTRYKVESTRYKNFLIQTLDTIAFPSGDQRAPEIIYFFASDKNIDENEWKAGLRALSKVGNYTISTWIDHLVARADGELAPAQARLAAYMTLVADGKAGLPKPITYEMGFFELIEGTRHNLSLQHFIYQTYGSRLKLDDKSKATLFSALHTMYGEETDATRKAEALTWLTAFINQNEYPKAHEQLFSFAADFKLTLNNSRNEEINRQYPASDLKVLVEKCREKFSAYALLSEYTSQREDRIEFCVINNIPVPGVIPTMAEAEKILNGNDLDLQLGVMAMLTLMNDKPRAIEPAILGLLGKRSLEDRDKLSKIQTAAIIVLGNIKTSNVRAIDFMIAALPHYGNDTEAAKEALVKVGKPAVKQLTTALDKTTEHEGGLQYQLIVLLGRIGKDASSASRAIQRVLSSTRNNDVKYAAEAALQAVQ
jgi:TolB-like protein